MIPFIQSWKNGFLESKFRGYPLLRWTFGLVILLLILLNFEPVQLPPHPSLLKNLWTGETQAFFFPGQEVAFFKPVLPSEGRFTFLTDTPYQTETENTETYLRAQNFLCPLILNPRPHEKTGLLYCKNPALSEARMTEEGYRWVLELKEGAGIILKKS